MIILRATSIFLGIIKKKKKNSYLLHYSSQPIAFVHDTEHTLYSSLSHLPISVYIYPKFKMSRTAMALSSAFRERLEHMELTRNQRLSLLQVPNTNTNLSLLCLVVKKIGEKKINPTHCIISSSPFLFSFSLTTKQRAKSL